jgi:hypothetical protein
MKDSVREMLRPLKSLKTAKSRDFGNQRYQGLSKSHDFAGEAVSFHLGFVFGLARNEKPIFGRANSGQNACRFNIRPCGPRNPLKRLKTANEMFGKACRFQAIDLEMFAVDLERLASRKPPAGPLPAWLLLDESYTTWK